MSYNAGIVTAYGAAVRGGYTGTYEEFCAQQANYAASAAAVEQAKEDVEELIESIPEDYSTLSDDVEDLKDGFINQVNKTDSGISSLDADWAVGKIQNGVYSPSDYYKVTTRSAVFLRNGCEINIENGYQYKVVIIGTNIYYDYGWLSNGIIIPIDGYYMISVRTVPESTERITDIEPYVNALTITSNIQAQINIISQKLNLMNACFEAYGKNLFDKSRTTVGYLVNRDTGYPVANANMSISDYIPVKNGDTLYLKDCNQWYSALYDTDKEYVSNLANATTMPIGSDGFVRVTVSNNKLDTAIVSKTYPLPDANDVSNTMIDKYAREEIEMGRTWSNTVETVTNALEIRDSTYHYGGSVDLSGYAFASVRVSNTLGVECTINFADDRVLASTNWMMRPDGSFVSIKVPNGASIVTADDLPELPYFKLFRPIITPDTTPTTGNIIIQIVGRK